MDPNQSTNINNSNDSDIINYIKEENSKMNIVKSSSNMPKNNSNEELLNMELKNIQMLILQRSLYILKKKFEINKKPLEIIYQKYKNENCMKLRCISVDYLNEMYTDVMETTQFTILPYTNFNELFSADLMTELNKDKSKIILKNLVKFTNQNIEKYNRIYFEKKMKKRQLLEENKKKINIVTNIDDMEEITNEKPITKINKRGKILQNFDEVLKNNIELKFGSEIIMTINEDDMSVLNNIKLLYSDVIPLIIADFLQEYLKNNQNLALISTSNIEDEENQKLNKNVKNLFDNEILKFYQNLAKFDPESENKEKVKNLLFDLMNTENQIKIYQKIILEQTAKGMNVKHLLNMVKKLNEQKDVLQKKINEYSINNNINNKSYLNSVNNTKSTFNKDNKKLKEMNKSNSSLKSQRNKNKLGNNGKYSNLNTSPNNKSIKFIKKNKSKEQISQSYQNTDENFISVKINGVNEKETNLNHLINSNKEENFYYKYGVLYPETKEELRNNSLLEIFYFYTKQHSFIGQTPTFEQFLKSEENLDLAEFGKFCVEFKILVKPQKIAEIFKKTSANSKTLSYKMFCEALKKLSVCANDEKKKYLMDRIKLFEMKLKEIEEKNKKNINKKKEENLSNIKSEGEAEDEQKCLDENNLENQNQPNNEQNNNNNTENKTENNKVENPEENNAEIKKENEAEINNKENKESTEKKETKETTNIKYYHQSQLKNAKNRKPIVTSKKKMKLVKPKTSTFLIGESKEELESKISKLKEDYEKLNKKTNTQLEEEFYQYLELDDINSYRKKMFGYVIPFRTKANYSRFPLHSVQNPPKQDPKTKKEMHKILVQRHEELIKEKEKKQMKEKNILFEKRMKKFEEDKIKIKQKMSLKNDYLQMKKNEEDYQKEKINKLTWAQIQKSDYDTFILNEKDKNRNNFNDIFLSQSNQFEGDDADYLKNFKNNKGFNEENNKINTNSNNSNKIIPKFDSNLSRISSGKNGGSNISELDIANAIGTNK